MSDYYDKQGVPIDEAEYLALAKDGGKKVGWTELGPLTVSTVWLGQDHSFGQGVPIIFETMVFREGPTSWGSRQPSRLAETVDGERYCMLAEAERGHARWVATVSTWPEAKQAAEARHG